MVGSEHSPARLLHHLVEATADRIPDSIAIESESHTITYRDLDKRANRLAHQLSRYGIAPDVRIAVLMDRSIDFAIAVLGVLKSGCAFVPIDPEWPIERIELVIRESGAVACLVRGSASSPVTAIVPTIDLLTAFASTASHCDQRPSTSAPSPDNLAYVIYTSGSTGRPKGVSIEHGSIVRHLESISRVYQLRGEDRSLFFHSVAFDPAIEQLFAPLHCGGRVILRGHGLWSAEEFATFVRVHGLTTVTLPAAYWLQLLRQWETARQAPALGLLRQVIVGGEPLPPAAAKLWRDLKLTHIRFLNDYGPTECTITATVHEIPPAPAANEACGRIPIGRPHACVEVLLLGVDGRRADPGESGELCISGGTLARGYLGRDDLTRERFTAHPTNAGARIYRTGDLARIHDDGTLDFLGRIDDQVKVRGHRIELGEVETALRRAPGVDQAAVIVVDKGEGDKHLAAFLTTSGGAALDRTALREALARSLPAPAVPSEFHLCSDLPMTANGKVDRVALAASVASCSSEAPAAPPQAGESIEDTVARAWLSCLGIRALERTANVFEHGATSFTVARVHQQLQTALKHSFSITLLFQHTSIQALAARLSARPEAGMSAAIMRARQQRAALTRRHPTAFRQ